LRSRWPSFVSGIEEIIPLPNPPHFRFVKMGRVPPEGPLFCAESDG
jgi:hypothetical protein